MAVTDCRTDYLADYLKDGPAKPEAVVILAHGAGTHMDSPFMDAYAGGVADAGLLCVRFEFPYMAARRKDGSRKPPNRMPVLIETWRHAIADVAGALPGLPIFIGGKSMGGRVASMLVSDAGKNNPHIRGVICLGYPFHPDGKPEKLRVKHLADIRTPILMIQGTRDTFGNQEEVSEYTLSDAVSIHWLEDGDHNSFKPRKASGRTEAQNWQEGIEALTGFVKAHATRHMRHEP